VTVEEIRRAGQILASAGWEVESAEPSELESVTETYVDLLSTDLAAMIPGLRPVISPSLYDLMMRLCALSDVRDTTNSRLHANRSFLMRLWSEFFARHPVVVGPTWTQLPWPVDADLDPENGLRLLEDTVRFITPGNLLGLPSVALPTGVVDGLPTGIQIYADQWREDLCLEVAETVECAVERPTPIDPSW
jgi:amidase